MVGGRRWVAGVRRRRWEGRFAQLIYKTERVKRRKEQAGGSSTRRSFSAEKRVGSKFFDKNFNFNLGVIRGGNSYHWVFIGRSSPVLGAEQPQSG
ncbi:hypothetical protein TIFTF001_035451 [Ficus carica]|uniref:Uncharacterized protein n=1 Tax=Ficus carica TaxID=3494 RepID=A0AA88E1K9_FICCA|nr:hypothetical protein TIFTF001_035451 [Ficus carica]